MITHNIQKVCFVLPLESPLDVSLMNTHIIPLYNAIPKWYLQYDSILSSGAIIYSQPLILIS